MNKVFLGIVLAVCVLGMLLVMLNDRLGRKSEPVASAPANESMAQNRSEEMEAAARALEVAEAAKALAPPPVERVPAAARESALPDREEIAKYAPGLNAPYIEEKPQSVPEELAPLRTDAARPSKVEAQPAPRVESVPPPVQKPAAPEQVPLTAEQKPAPAAQKPAPKAETRPARAGARSINRFVIYAREKGATVRIGGTSKLDYTSMTLTDPDRVVIDLPGDWKFPTHPGVPKNDLVSAVRVGQQGDKTRVVIDLKGAAKVKLVPFKAGDGVDVRVDK